MLVLKVRLKGAGDELSIYKSNCYCRNASGFNFAVGDGQKGNVNPYTEQSIEATRVCNRCGETKPSSEFSKGAGVLNDGYAYWCKACVAKCLVKYDIDRKEEQAAQRAVRNSRRHMRDLRTWLARR